MKPQTGRFFSRRWDETISPANNQREQTNIPNIRARNKHERVKATTYINTADLPQPLARLAARHGMNHQDFVLFTRNLLDAFTRCHVKRLCSGPRFVS